MYILILLSLCFGVIHKSREEISLLKIICRCWLSVIFYFLVYHQTIPYPNYSWILMQTDHAVNINSIASHTKSQKNLMCWLSTTCNPHLILTNIFLLCFIFFLFQTDNEPRSMCADWITMLITASLYLPKLFQSYATCESNDENYCTILHTCTTCSLLITYI